MKKIGFFGGSFNPPTIAHFEIVNSAIKEFNLDEIVIVPMGDKYQKEGLIDFKHRYNMLKLLFKNTPKARVSNLQENQTKISYAIDTFNIIDKKYENDERFFIMGFDNFSKINTWKDSEKLLNNRKYIVFAREEFNINNMDANQVKVLNVNKNISSSILRKKIETEEDIKNLTTSSVIKYIEQNGLYK